MKYKIKEAAEYLGVSPETLRRWDKAGILVPMRTPIGGHRIYDQEQLDEFKRKNTAA